MTLEPYTENQTEQDPFIIVDYEFKLGIIEDLPISKLRPSSTSIRSGIAEIDLLAQSIKEKGLLQPIIVRPKDEYFEVVAGNRRYNACKSLGWRKIPCHIVELDDKAAFEISLIENIQRETMEPIEEAEAYKKYVADFGWGSMSELAKRIGKSSSFISKRISMLELPEYVLEKIKSHDINPSAAEELLSVENADFQSELGRLIATRHVSIRKVRELVQTNRDNHEDVRYEEHDLVLYSTNDSENNIVKSERAYDKAIILLSCA